MTGDFNKVITVQTNDPENPTIKLTCKGKILEPVKLNPARFNFGRFPRNSPAQTQTITVTRGDSTHFKPKLVAPAARGIEAQLREVEPNEKYEIIVTVDPSKAGERVATNITLETGVPESPTAMLTVYGQVIPRVTPTPSRFTVQSGMDREQTLSVQLRWDDGKPGKIVSESVNDSHLSVKVEQEGDSQFVRLTVPADYTPSPGDYAVTLLTDDPDAQTVRIPISHRSVPGRRTAGTIAPRPAGQIGPEKGLAPPVEVKSSDH